MFLEKLEKKSKLIDNEIKSFFSGKKDNLNDAVFYHLRTGGKKLRPVIAISVCETLGGDVKKILPFAAACEIFHNWCLIHDDIIDKDKIRRKKPAVWIKYGLEHGINIGDYMSEKVYELILKSKNRGVENETVFRLLRAMNETALKTSEGQAMDINFRAKIPTEKEYMKMVILKTGYYLTVPIVGGALVAGSDEKTISKIWKFGMYVGPAFQIIDDILDLTKNKGRGEIGRDIKEGKKSILIIHCLSKCNSLEKKKLLNILNKSQNKTNYKDIEFVKSLFEKYKSIDYATQKSNHLIKKAKIICPKELKEILEEFADYLIARSN